MEGAWVRTHAGAPFSTSFPAFYPHEQGRVLTSVQLQKMAGIQLCRAHAEPGLLDSPLLRGLVPAVTCSGTCPLGMEG